MKSKRLIKLSLLSAAVSALSLITSSADISQGDTFPQLSGFGLEGNVPSLKGKVVLVDIWASWCKPCKESFPVFDELLKAYSSKGFSIVAVSVDEEKGKYEKFIAKLKPAFLTLHDSEHKLAATLKPPGMPSSYLIDKKGKLRFLHKGFTKKTRAEYIKEIEALLSE